MSPHISKTAQHSCRIYYVMRLLKGHVQFRLCTFYFSFLLTFFSARNTIILTPYCCYYCRCCFCYSDKKAACFAVGGALKAGGWILLQCEIECCNTNGSQCRDPTLSQNAITVFTPRGIFKDLFSSHSQRTEVVATSWTNFIHLFIYLFTYLFIHSFIYLLIYLFVCLFIYLFLSCFQNILRLNSICLGWKFCNIQRSIH